jgi:MinD superfamily P-loop ATPase
MKKGLIINKYDINLDLSDKIVDFAKENNISLLAKIPFDKEFVKAMTAMIPLIDFNKGYKPMFNDIANKITSVLFE